MKIVVDRKLLLDRIGTANSSTGKGHDTLKLIRLEAKTEVTLQATDKEVGMILDCEAEIIKPGRCLLDPATVQSLLGASNAETVEIHHYAKSVTVVAGKSRFELPSHDVDEFPAITKVEDNCLDVQASALCSAITRTKFAVDPDSSRYQLGGVLFEHTEGDMLNLVGTDGRRLSHVLVCVQGDAPCNAIVPLKGLQAILKAFSGAGQVRITSNASTLQVTSETSTVVCSLVGGKYPKWETVIPKDSTFKDRLPIESGPLTAAIRQAGVTTETESRGVDLRFSPGMLQITSKGADRGSSEIELCVDSSAQTNVTIDWRFALDFCQHVPDDDVVKLLISSAKDPVKFIWGSWQYVIMPMSRS